MGLFTGRAPRRRFRTTVPLANSQSCGKCPLKGQQSWAPAVKRGWKGNFSSKVQEYGDSVLPIVGQLVPESWYLVAEPFHLQFYPENLRHCLFTETPSSSLTFPSIVPRCSWDPWPCDHLPSLVSPGSYFWMLCPHSSCCPFSCTPGNPS